MSRLDPLAFRRSFESLLDPADEVVVVYSGIWTFGHQFGLPIMDVPAMLIETMLEAVGPDRTLMLPAYTYAYAGTRSYSPRHSVPETGVLPQTCLRLFDWVRTGSALNSFLCAGPRARDLVRIRGETLWGEDSLKGALEKTRARMITLGIPWKDSLGYLHRIEEKAQVPYRYYKTFNGEWVDESGTQPWKETMYVRSMDLMPVFVWSRVDRLLRERNRIRKGGLATFMESADAADIVAAGMEILADDPYAMLENDEDVRHWVLRHRAEEMNALRAREPAALEYQDRLYAGGN